MKTLLYSIRYGEQVVAFELTYSRRKTMQIAVYPEGKVFVKAPEGTPLEKVKMHVRRRSRWIKKQLEYFRQFEPRTPPRRYISGETHFYLGKRYRLKVIESDDSSVKMSCGFLRISVKEIENPSTVKKQLDRWYFEKAVQHFSASFDRCWPIFEKQGLLRPHLKIRTMKTRWGSLSSKGNMTLNIALIRAPRECIDYVMTHELCHLAHSNHSPAFFQLLEQTMPDWKKHKMKLELETEL